MRPFRPAVVRSSSLSPAAYLARTPAQRRDIQVVRLIPPMLGKPGFGGIKVTHKAPRYRPF